MLKRWEGKGRLCLVVVVEDGEACRGRTAARRRRRRVHQHRIGIIIFIAGQMLPDFTAFYRIYPDYLTVENISELVIDALPKQNYRVTTGYYPGIPTYPKFSDLFR